MPNPVRRKVGPPCPSCGKQLHKLTEKLPPHEETLYRCDGTAQEPGCGEHFVLRQGKFDAVG